MPGSLESNKKCCNGGYPSLVWNLPQILFQGSPLPHCVSSRRSVNNIFKLANAITITPPIQLLEKSISSIDEAPCLSGNLHLKLVALSLFATWNIQWHTASYSGYSSYQRVLCMTFRPICGLIRPRPTHKSQNLVHAIWFHLVRCFMFVHKKVQLFWFSFGADTKYFDFSKCLRVQGAHFPRMMRNAYILTRVGINYFEK